MRVVVFGAAGRTGRLLVERALGHGHDVTAFVHRTPLPVTHPRLAVVTGDVLEFGEVTQAIDAQSAVAVALASSRSDVPGFHQAALANVVHSMATVGARRLSVMSAAGTFARTDPNLSLAARTMMATVLKSTYDDLEAMERRVMASDLDWAIVRPVGLADEAASGDYRISLDGSVPRKPKRIARADVAGVLLKALETDTYLRRTVVVAG